MGHTYNYANDYLFTQSPISYNNHRKKLNQHKKGVIESLISPTLFNNNPLTSWDWLAHKKA